MILLDGTMACHDRPTELVNAARYGAVPIPNLERANTLAVPLGRACARGWFLIASGDLANINLDAYHTITFDDGTGTNTPVVQQNLVITREPMYHLPTGVANDPAALFLVEFSDPRWLVYNPYFQTGLNAQYNVRAPGWDGIASTQPYYADSLNAGQPWTWDKMCSDIWGRMSSQLGPYPGLPFTPNGNPESFRFPGTPAWLALCEVLERLGCAVWPDLSFPLLPIVPAGQTPTFSIAQVGATPPTGDSFALTSAEPVKLFDGAFQNVTRGKLPYGIVVFFHVRNMTYGTERTTPQLGVGGTGPGDAGQFVTNGVYSVTVVGPAAVTAKAENQIYHHLWDDLPALYDATNTLQNGAALTARAQERAADYYRMNQDPGGSRLWRVYSGALGTLRTNSQIKGVAWRQTDRDEKGGIVTEVVRHPFAFLSVGDDGRWQEREPKEASSTALRARDLRVREPLYPDLLVPVLIGTGSADDCGRFPSLIEQPQEFACTGSGSGIGVQWQDREPCSVVDLNGNTPVTGMRYHGRIVGNDGTRPIISVEGPCFDVPLNVVTEVCPQFGIDDDSGGSGSGTGMGSKFLTHIIVEKRQIILPCGTMVGPPECITDPSDCCGSSTGTNTGSGGSILTQCCPSNPVPALLHFALANVTHCPCLDGVSGTLLFNGIAWTPNTMNGFVTLPAGCTQGMPTVLSMSLTCGPAVGGGFKWQLSLGQCFTIGGNRSLTLNSASCNPLQLVFTASALACGCCLPDSQPFQATFTITITP